MSVKSKVKRWYLGGPLPTSQRNSESSVTTRLPNTYEPSTSAQIAQYIVKHLIHILAIIIGAIVALFIHFDGKQPESEPNQEKINKVGSTGFHNNLPTYSIATANKANSVDAKKRRA